MQAFKRLYEEVGLGWVYAFTRINAVCIVYMLQCVAKQILSRDMELQW
jgi:hypothetical protein